MEMKRVFKRTPPILEGGWVGGFSLWLRYPDPGLVNNSTGCTSDILLTAKPGEHMWVKAQGQ